MQRVLAMPRARWLAAPRRVFLSTPAAVPPVPPVPPSPGAAAASARPPIPAGHVGKLKAPTKRAKHLLNQLEKEFLQGAASRPNINPGDSVEVTMKDWRSAKPRQVTGVVEAINRKHSWAASLRLISVVGDARLRVVLPLHSPLVQTIKVLQPAFIHRGARRVRKAKLYYLDDWAIGRLRVGLSKEAQEDKARVKAKAEAARDKAKRDKLREKKKKRGK